MTNTPANTSLKTGNREMSQYALYLGYYLIFCLAVGFFSIVPQEQVEKFHVAISIIFLLMLLSISTIFVARYRKSFDVFEPINLFNGIMGLFFVLYPLHMLLNQYRAILVYKQAGADLQQFLPFLFMAINYVVIGVGCFFTGYTLFLNKRMGKKLNFLKDGFSGMEKKYMYFLLALGTTLWLVWMYINGGVSFLINIFTSSSNYRRGLIETHGSHLSWSSLLFIIPLMYLYLYHLKSTGKKMIFFSVLFCLGGLSVYARATSVSSLVLFFVNFLILYHYSRRKINIKKALIIFLILLMVIFFLKISYNISQRWEVENFNRIVNFAFQSQESIFYFFVGSKFTGADVFSVILKHVPETFAHMGFQIFLQPMWNILPTGFFENLNYYKTIGNQFASAVLGKKRGGKNPTFFGVLYIGFGLPGIILGSFLYGLFSRTIFEYLQKNRDRPLFLIFYTVTISYITIYFTRIGAPTVAFQRYFYLIFILLSVVIFSRICILATSLTKD